MIARPRWEVLTLVVVLALALVGVVGWLFRDGNLLGADEPEVVRPAAAAPEVDGPAGALPPDEQPGSPAVQLSAQALSHPQGERVRLLLQTYFDAINNGDFEIWTSTVTSDQVQAADAAVWQRQYNTTRDGSILVQHIQPELGHGLRVLVSFTSTQDPADAPRDAPFRCLRWRVSYPVVVERGALHIARAEAESSQHATC